MYSGSTSGGSFSGNRRGDAWSSGVDGGEGEVSVVATVSFPLRNERGLSHANDAM